jgi:2-polyprenyl-3-methyl-5-hydroxy-6-metoxy-1,4-benzoquinol methylase
VIEPYRAQFVEMLRRGAGQGDIHGQDSPCVVSEAFIRRELDRPAMHRRSMVNLLVNHGVTASRILDVGCSTGGTTAALASWYTGSKVLAQDVNEKSVDAAKVRLLGLQLKNAIAYAVPPGPLPYPDASFDLVTCVSVLEFVPEGRGEFLAELQRVVRPGGHVYLSTPNPYVLRELHSRRWLGNQRRRPDYPWASTRGDIAAGLDGCEAVSTDAYVARRWRCPGVVARVLPWQKLLYRRR